MRESIMHPAYLSSVPSTGCAVDVEADVLIVEAAYSESKTAFPDGSNIGILSWGPLLRLLAALSPFLYLYLE